MIGERGVVCEECAWKREGGDGAAVKEHFNVERAVHEHLGVVGGEGLCVNIERRITVEDSVKFGCGVRRVGSKAAEEHVEGFAVDWCMTKVGGHVAKGVAHGHETCNEAVEGRRGWTRVAVKGEHALGVVDQLVTFACEGHQVIVVVVGRADGVGSGRMVVNKRGDARKPTCHTDHL